MKALTFGSLFAGIGGFDLGLHRAGMRPKWQVEIDAPCLKVLREHFPRIEAARPADVRGAGRGNLEATDVICGGFPCQDLSVAGRRAGLRGERSGLFWEFHRILREMRPRWCIVENVPGLLSSGGGRDFGAVLGALAGLGYGLAYRVLDARWFGLAQRRRRVFVVGCLGNAGRAAQVLLEPEGVRGDSPQGREAQEDAAGDVAACLRSGGGGPDDNAAQARHLVAFGGNNAGGPIRQSAALNACKPASGRQDFATETFVTHALTGEGHDASEDGTGRGVPLITFSSKDDGRDVQRNKTPTLRAMNNHKGEPNGGGQMAVAYPLLEVGARTGKSASDPRAGAGIGDSSDPMFTLQSSKQHGVSSAFGVRRLTPTECERLQGFPDGWTLPMGADSPRYRALGNAVAVPVAEWIGRRIVASCRSHG